MSEFPEWIERAKGVLWSPSYEEGQRVHREEADGLWPDPRGRGMPIWWRHYWPFNRRRSDRT